MVRRRQETWEQKIILGFFRGICWLFKLPFRGAEKKNKLSVADHQYFFQKKSEIEKLANSDNHLELQHAVIEADKLVDWALKRKNYPGATFAERLRAAEKSIAKNVYNSIWQGHKIRNQIAHEDGKIAAEILRTAVRNLLLY